MMSTHRYRCDECKSVEMILLELDHVDPAKIATRERELIRAIVE